MSEEGTESRSVSHAVWRHKYFGRSHILTLPRRQRAFRERKELRIKALEEELRDLQRHSATMIVENARLRNEIASVRMGDLCITSYPPDGKRPSPCTDERCGHGQISKSLKGPKRDSATGIGVNSDLSCVPSYGKWLQS